MESIAVLQSAYFSNDTINETVISNERIAAAESGYNPAIVKLIAEGGVNIYRYLKNFNLSNESNLMILPSNRHYYYDEDDFKSVRTLINLKRLDLIKEIDMFLNILYKSLPPDINFIGCFSDTKTQKKKGLKFVLFRKLKNILDSKTYHNMNKHTVSKYLNKYGFVVVDMEEINGLTYFYSKKNPTAFLRPGIAS